VNDLPYWPILYKLIFFAKDKRSSLFCHAVSDEENILITLTYVANVIKTLSTLSLLVNNRLVYKRLPETNGLAYFITLSLLVNNRIGWKCLPRTNGLAYLVIPISDVEKSFVELTPESNSIKTFYGHNLRMFIISWSV
jgi:hypothetical protein